ncbi:hypothetical protein AB0B94_30790 [Micromonospora sp. NPDC048986]|uniref:hypothetical protein n=1 Tax=Micromonospora sp. NPDC048986 TaxID=3155644 RepID=UPI0033F284C4
MVVRRRSAVYGIPTLPVDSAGRVVPGPPVVGYIGQTAQTVKQREDQHRETQPFGDVIFGGSWTIEEGYWTQAELDAKEEWYIRNGAVLVPGQSPQRPVYNYIHNTENPKRIEVWRAVEHRQVREPGWVQSAKGERVPQQRAVAYPARVAAPVRYGAWAWFRRHPAAQVAVVLLVVFGALVWASAGRLDGWDPAGAGLAGVAGVFGLALVDGRTWARLWRELTGTRRRRRRR